jgi:TPR repeat protein
MAMIDYRRLATAVLLLCLISGPGIYAQSSAMGLNASQLFEKGMNNLIRVGANHSDLNAVDYIRRSAELGYAPAQVVLGYLYDTGNRLSQNSGEAADWYKKAAKQDDHLAAWLLGRLYYTGFGIPCDLSAAESWLQKAADQGDPFGQYLLGMSRVERNDYSQAAEWFRKAAMQGLPQAQQQLGELLLQGKGVNTDKFEAYVWLLMSFEAGKRGVANELQSLEAELGTNKVEEAKTKARELQEKASRAVVAHGCVWPGYENTVPLPPPPDVQRFCR